MAKVQLDELTALIDRVVLNKTTLDSITCKHFFNGAAAYIESHIFMTLTTVGLAVKLPEHDRTQLIALGAKPLRYFPKAPIKKDYVILPGSVIEDEVMLASWVEASIKFSRL